MRLDAIEKIMGQMPAVSYWTLEGTCIYANRSFLDKCGAVDIDSFPSSRCFELIRGFLESQMAESQEAIWVEDGFERRGFRISYARHCEGYAVTGYIVQMECLPQKTKPTARSADGRKPETSSDAFETATMSAGTYTGIAVAEILETIPESFCILDGNWNIQYWNGAAERTTGQVKADVLGRNMWQVFPQERDSILYAQCEAAMHDGRHRSFEHNSVTGTWYYNSVHPNAAGGLTIYFRDVTERRQAQEQLVEVKNNLDGLLNATDDLMWSVDASLKLISSNTAFEEYVQENFGYVYHAGENVAVDKLTMERKYSCEAFYRRCLAGESFSTQMPAMGDRLTRYNPIYRTDGRVSGVACHSVDLSELLRLEREKADSAERFRALVQNGSDLIFIFGIGYSLEYVSPSALSILGSRIHDRKKLMSLLHQEDYAAVLAAFKNGRRRKTFTVQPFRIRNASGSYMWLEAIVDNLLDNPAVVGTVVNARDVTAIQEREAEHEAVIKELVRSNSDLTQFSYITSHNLRAPLSNILGLLQHIDRSTLDDDVAEVLSMLDGAALNLSSTMDDLSRILLVRNGVLPQKQPVDILECFHNANRNYIEKEQELGAYLTIKLGVPSVNFDKKYLESIFSSLISNAIRFRQPGRILEMSFETAFDPGGGVTMRFLDNGSGLDMDRHAGRVFGMYQRFHPNMEGKGMSLFMAQAQLQALGGSISMESVPNEYAAFTIFIP